MRCFVRTRGGKSWWDVLSRGVRHGMFYPGMFCLTFNVALCSISAHSGSFTVCKNTHLGVTSTERVRKVLIWQM